VSIALVSIEKKPARGKVEKEKEKKKE